MNKKELLLQFRGKTFSSNKDVLEWLDKALDKVIKETQQATIKAMLVEERGRNMSEPFDERFEKARKEYWRVYENGFNWCCVLQRKWAEKLKVKLKNKLMSITLKDFRPDNIPTQKQVESLGQFLIENFEDEIGGEKSGGEGAVEMAVRLLIELKECRKK